MIDHAHCPGQPLQVDTTLMALFWGMPVEGGDKYRRGWPPNHVLFVDIVMYIE